MNDRSVTKTDSPSSVEDIRPVDSRGLPVVEELRPVPDVMATLLDFSSEPALLLLESSLKRERLGRYSFLCADPVSLKTTNCVTHGFDPFNSTKRQLAHFRTDRVTALPPFQGGAAGLLSYESGGAWEQIPRPGRDEFRLPDVVIGLYDWVIAWDHQSDRAWIISQGLPETGAARRTDRAHERIKWVRARLGRTGETDPSCGPIRQLPVSELARQYPAPGPAGVTSNFSRDGYLRSVARIIEYIEAGDIFQANLSQRLLAPLKCSPLELYGKLRRCNPAPCGGYLSIADWAVLSSSPERFLSLADGEIETRPIKGTRQRRVPPEADLLTRDELRESLKDQAENVMIVDLLRNDLSRVCVPGSVSVPELCTVEMYETVLHLVSEIRARISPEFDAWDLMAAAFPGGSITGAPKVRSMEIIAEQEPTVRGPYCGSLFSVGLDGTLDSNILIRTFTVRNGWIQCPVGGGITARSHPEQEYLETLHKAEGMLRALV